MKKYFEQPEITVQAFEVEDIVTTSGGGTIELPNDEFS